MRYIALTILLTSSSALAQEACPKGATCVSSADLQDMVGALKAQRCLKTEQPRFVLDPITIITDQDRRIFVSGEVPHPYTLKMQWCSYEVIGTGTVSVQAAVQSPPVYGWGFRPKVMVGLLGVAAFSRDRVTDAIDAGIAIEPFHYHSLNVNAVVGIRSVGAGIGLDITRNLGIYLGYAATWKEWQHNPTIGLYGAIW